MTQISSFAVVKHLHPFQLLAGCVQAILEAFNFNFTQGSVEPLKPRSQHLPQPTRPCHQGLEEHIGGSVHVERRRERFLLGLERFRGQF